MLKLFRNTWTKVVSLTLGLLLWVHVATEKEYSYELDLPITDIILKDNLTLAKKPADSLTVIVSATGKRLLRQKWRHRGVRINASHLAVGSHDFNLSPSNTSLILANNITLEEVVFPNSMTLTVDKLDERKVAVEADVDVSADQGYTIKKIDTPLPDSVLLTGPQSILANTESVKTETVRANGLRTDHRAEVPLVPPEGYMLSLVPDSVVVVVEVVPVKTRIFGNVPIVVFNRPTDRTVKLSPEFVQIELTGPPTEIDQLPENALVASVSFNQLVSGRKAAINIDCPSSFKVRRLSADSVMVQIN